MTGVLEVLQGVAIATNTSVLLTTAVGQATRETKPEIGREVAFSALARD